VRLSSWIHQKHNLNIWECRVWKQLEPEGFGYFIGFVYSNDMKWIFIHHKIMFWGENYECDKCWKVTRRSSIVLVIWKENMQQNCSKFGKKRSHTSHMKTEVGFKGYAEQPQINVKCLAYGFIWNFCCVMIIVQFLCKVKT